MKKLFGLLKKPPETAEYHILVEGKTVPVFFTLERRNNCRASIGKKGIHIRLARHLGKRERQRQTEHFLKWAREKVVQKGLPGVTPRIEYADGQQINLRGQSFHLLLEPSSNKTARGKLENGIIHIRIPENTDALQSNELVGKLVSRLAGAHFLAAVSERVHDLNARHFQKTVGNIRLKNNRSNWGSCSVKGNINLSTRLLMAPTEVMDYVIVHELAHLTHHNHSPAFWKLVEKAMPNYKVQEKWLRHNGRNCVF